MEKCKIRTFKRTKGTIFDPKDPKSISVTKQSFKKDCDINVIMKRQLKSGVPFDPRATGVALGGMYGDFINGTDFVTVQNRLLEANKIFDSMSSDIRKRFNNKPAELFDFLADLHTDDNLMQEAIDLGLVPRDERVDYAEKKRLESEAKKASEPSEGAQDAGTESK